MPTMGLIFLVFFKKKIIFLIIIFLLKFGFKKKANLLKQFNKRWEKKKEKGRRREMEKMRPPWGSNPRPQG